MNITHTIDKIVGVFSPRAQRMRERERILTDIMRDTKQRSYEAASFGGRAGSWHPRGQDADSENRNDIETIRSRVRDVYRNNPWAKSGVDILVNNTIGTGIVARTEKKPVNDAWKRWANTTLCDFNDELTLSGIQRLFARTMFITGECLIRKVLRKPTPDNPFVLQLQVLEPDFLDTSKDDLFIAGKDRYVNKTVQGVVHDNEGRITGYWIFDEHPNGENSNIFDSHLVPRSELIHIHDFRRAGETRAASRLAPILHRLRNIDMYEDAELQKQHVAAMYAAFYRNVECDDLKQVGEATVPTHMEAGTIEMLPDGYDVTFSNPPSKEGYSEYMRQQLLAVSAGLGITYESLSTDLRQTSFSSGRIGQHEMSRHIQSVQNDIFIPQAMARIWKWFSEASTLTAGMPMMRNLVATWHTPARFIVDVKSETEADIKNIRAGITSLQSVHRSRGEDSDLVLEEIIEMNAKLDAGGIIIDTDPRFTDRNGSVTDRSEVDDEETETETE